MPRQPEHDLAPFREWLEEDRLVSPVTSRSYSAVVSALLTDLGEDMSQESINRAFEPRIGKSSYANYRTGWKAFTEFAFERGATVPMPDKPEVTEEEVPPVPVEGLRVAASLREQKMAPASLRALTWSHIRDARVDTSCYEVVDPYRPAAFVLVPKLILDPWREQREAKDGKSLPVFSEMRGARVRYPTKLLMQQVKDFRGLQTGEKKSRTRAPQRGTGAAVSIEELRAAHMAKLTLTDPEMLTSVRGAALPRGGDRFEADPEEEEEIEPVHSTADLAALLNQATNPQQQATGTPGFSASVLPVPVLGVALCPVCETRQCGSLREEKDGLLVFRPAGEFGECTKLTPAQQLFGDGMPGYGAAGEAEGESDVLEWTFTEEQVEVAPAVLVGALRPLCLVCRLPRDQHAEHFGLADGTINNCAEENGYEADTCQMCRGACPGRHRFKVQGVEG